MKAARTCLVAVVVLSQDYLTSKWPITELMAFSDATERHLSGTTFVNPNYNKSMKLVLVVY